MSELDQEKFKKHYLETVKLLLDLREKVKALDQLKGVVMELQVKVAQKERELEELKTAFITGEKPLKQDEIPF